MLLGRGDSHGLDVTGEHPTAAAAPEARRRVGNRPTTRLARKLDDLLWRLV
jgi:hypothetical protein